MKDLHGLEYDELLAVQERHLALWRQRLLPFIVEGVTKYVLSHNQPAPTPDQKHCVLRGQDIIQVIMEWPNLSPAYPTNKVLAASELI